MIKATVYNQIGEKVKEIDLNPKIFGLKVKPELVTQAVLAQQANARQVLAHAKDRSEVSGGGKKPWRQKGTGRARHGSIRSPLWRAGGVTFGPNKDRNFSVKINRKAKRKAILMVLSSKAADQKIILLDKLELEQAKTKKFFEILQNLDLRIKKTKKRSAANQESKKAIKQENKKDKTKSKKEKSILLILPSKNEKIQRAARNIYRLNIIQANSLNVLDLIKQQYLLMPVDSLQAVEKTFVK